MTPSRSVVGSLLGVSLALLCHRFHPMLTPVGLLVGMGIPELDRVFNFGVGQRIAAWAERKLFDARSEALRMWNEWSLTWTCFLPGAILAVVAMVLFVKWTWSTPGELYSILLFFGTVAVFCFGLLSACLTTSFWYSKDAGREREDLLPIIYSDSHGRALLRGSVGSFAMLISLSVMVLLILGGVLACILVVAPLAASLGLLHGIKSGRLDNLRALVVNSAFIGGTIIFVPELILSTSGIMSVSLSAAASNWAIESLTGSAIDTKVFRWLSDIEIGRSCEKLADAIFSPVGYPCGICGLLLSRL